MDNVFSEIGEPSNKVVLEYMNGLNSDIISVIHTKTKEGARQVKNIAANFLGENKLHTCFKIWDFLKNKINYKIDPDEKQVIQLPKYFLKNKSGDCKSFSLFTNSILAALYPNDHIIYRYASYNPGDKTPTHVYCIHLDEFRRPIIIDAVFDKFNAQKKPAYYFDREMKIYSISGIGDFNLNQAWNNFQTNLQNTWNNLSQGAQTALNNQEAQIQALKEKVKAQFTFIENKVEGLSEEIKEDLSDVRKWNIKDALKFVYNRLSVGPAMAVPRASFLALVKLNFRDLARKLDKAFAQNYGTVNKYWFALGGDINQLRAAVNEGKNKQMIGSINGIGEGYTIGAIVSAAVTVTATMVQMLFKMGIIGKGEKESYAGDDYLRGNGISPEEFYNKLVPEEKPKAGIFDNKLLLIGAAGLGAYLLLND